MKTIPLPNTYYSSDTYKQTTKVYVPEYFYKLQ